MEHVLGAVRTLQNTFDGGWVPEKSFAHPLGFGSKVDLHLPDVILDIKTKEFSADKVPDTYDEHAMQLGAYRHGLLMPTAQAGILFVSASVPGLCHLVMLPEEELEKGWECFKGLLAYWRAKTGYKP